MPLRVLLFAVPEKDEEAVAALLAEAGPWAAWRSREGGEVLYHVFLEAGQVEPVSDALQNRFGKALRLAVLPVEAVVPPRRRPSPPRRSPRLSAWAGRSFTRSFPRPARRAASTSPWWPWPPWWRPWAW